MPSIITVGDTVKVTSDLAAFKEGQKGHGGWNADMQSVCGMTGVVKRIEDGDAFVEFPSGKLWHVNGQMISKVEKLTKGQKVRVSGNVGTVKRLQKGHGGFVDDMMNILGKTGEVVGIDEDGDLQVQIIGSNRSWTLNPDCCDAEDGSSDDEEGEGPAGLLGALLLGQLLEQLSGVQTARGPTNAAGLVREAALGNTANVKKIIEQHKDWIDFRTEDEGYSALQVSCHEGKLEVVKVLANAGAKINEKDKDGDTAFSFAVIGRRHAVAEYLLESHSAKKNIANKKGMVPLHIAVWHEDIECVRVLLKFNCDCNMQDNDGDTPLHLAIMKNNDDIVDLLVSNKQLEPLIINRKGFNVLHLASMKDNKHAVKKLMQQRNMSLVQSKKEDGFTSLHLAAFNNHTEIATMLIEDGKAKIDALTLAQQTPLMLAGEKKFTEVSRYLIKKGVDVNLQDKDGDTALHEALRKKNMDLGQNLLAALLGASHALTGSSDDNEDGVKLATVLVENGADLTIKNLAGKTPLDIADDEDVSKKLKAIKGSTRPVKNNTTNLRPNTAGGSCMICSDNRISVTFKPCGHRLACVPCAKIPKKCLRCGKAITQKVGPNGKNL